VLYGGWPYSYKFGSLPVGGVPKREGGWRCGGVADSAWRWEDAHTARGSSRREDSNVFDRRLTIALSSAGRDNLSKRQVRFAEALQQKLEGIGFRVLPDSPSSDRIEERLSRFRKCHGAIILVLSQWEGRRLHRDQDKTVILPTEFNHMAAVMAVAEKKPVLVLREKIVTERGSFRRGYIHPVINLPTSLDPDWLDSAEFGQEFAKWTAEVTSFRHVFLGYSSQATETANMFRKFLADKLGLRVFDWHDFRANDTIWESTERAERLTSCGVFLFMADDAFALGGQQLLAPRDNVVYEAGYFTGAKGRSQALIIREEGAKMPTDLGGMLFLLLQDRTNIAPIETRLRETVERMLGEGL